MPVMLKRRNGEITPYRNAEFIPAYYFIPRSVLEKCGAELNSIPRKPYELLHSWDAIAVVESDLFRLLIIDAYAFMVWPFMGLGTKREIYSGYEPSWIFAHSPAYWIQEMIDEKIIPTAQELLKNGGVTECFGYVSEEEISNLFSWLVPKVMEKHNIKAVIDIAKVNSPRASGHEIKHLIRADAVEQVVMLELKRLTSFLRDDEDTFAELLAQKTNKDILEQQKLTEGELQKSSMRIETVSRMYEKLYEDNVTGKVTDEWFMQLSHKYEVERMELKSKIADLKEHLVNLSTMQQSKEQFICAVRKFMEMEKLTAPLLKELIDHIDVYETEGKGKSRTQRIVIYYRFVGYIEIPDSAFRHNYTADTRQGVAVEYVPKAIPA